MGIPPLNFSVVICAYTEERWNDLISAVRAVERQTQPPQEIIVVIDHNPRLFQRLRQVIPGLITIENQEARGLSGARNCGVRAAQGEVVAFIDEDAIPAPDWLECLASGYTGQDVLGVGGAIEPLWFSRRPNWFPEEFDWVVGCTYLGMPLTAAPVRNLIGCNMSFRREIFRGIGGFRSGIGRVGTLPVGCEETEFCIRAHQKWTQGVMRYEPLARVYHRIPPNRTLWRYFQSRCYYEGRSKALVTSLTGKEAGLASEWTYTLQTLPRGIKRNVVSAYTGQNRSGLAKAGAIIAGLSFTTTGYLVGVLSERLNAASRRIYSRTLDSV